MPSKRTRESYMQGIPIQSQENRSQSATPNDIQSEPSLVTSTIPMQTRRLLPAFTPMQTRRLMPALTPSPTSLLPVPQANQTSSAGSQPGPSRSTTPAQRPKSGPGSFWTAEGMNAFVDWMTDPHNYEKLKKVRTVAGQTKADIHEQIANHVNGIAGTGWTVKVVKNKIDYAKKKYEQAKELASAAGGSSIANLVELRKQMLEICPEYDRFHAVWGSSPVRNSLPPKESCKRYTQEPFEREFSPETIETDEQNNNSDSSSESVVNSDLFSHESGDEPTTKRRKAIRKDQKRIDKEINFVKDTVYKLRAEVNSSVYHNSRNITWNDAMQRREMAMEERERNHEETLRRRGEAFEALLKERNEELKERERNHEEMLRRRGEAFEALLKERKEEFERERKEILDRRIMALDEEKKEFKAEVAEFKEKQETLLQENAALHSEMELCRGYLLRWRSANETSQ
ncbi:hypothetical protein BGX27_001143 [Mortierella sp. AM989]|nr:hypothetical protein BGX27_001143 [Mortierella sp. AM989]